MNEEYKWDRQNWEKPKLTVPVEKEKILKQDWQGIVRTGKTRV